MPKCTSRELAQNPLVRELFINMTWITCRRLSQHDRVCTSVRAPVERNARETCEIFKSLHTLLWLETPCCPSFLSPSLASMHDWIFFFFIQCLSPSFSSLPLAWVCWANSMCCPRILNRKNQQFKTLRKSYMFIKNLLPHNAAHCMIFIKTRHPRN